MIDESDIKQICQDAINNDRKMELVLHRSEEQAELTTQFEDLTSTLTAADEGVFSVSDGDGTSLPGAPGLSLNSNIHYMALPEGFESEPFVDALKGLAGSSAPTGDWVADLAAVTDPAELLVFIGPTCPHCPKAVRAAVNLALVNDRIKTVVIDVMRFPSLGEELGIKSVPFTLVDQKLGEAGVIPAEELSQRILARNTIEFDLFQFNALLESQQLPEAIETVKKTPEIFAAAWRKSTTSSRLGLMVIAEEMLEEDPAALDGIVPELIAVLELDDITLRGDTADILGQIGHSAAVPALETLKNDANPDVVEIATDSLEMIAERNG